MDQFDDLISMEAENQKRKRRIVAYVLAIFYFGFMFAYTISISGRDMPFYTKVTGFPEVQQNQSLKLRAFIIGTKEMMPLRAFYAKLELKQPDGKMLRIFSGHSGRENYLDIKTPPLTINPGTYVAILTTGRKDYGEETNELTIQVNQKMMAHSVEVQKLDEKFTTPFRPIRTDKLEPAMELRLVPGNGRFIPNLNNEILLLAEERASGLPVEDVEITIENGGKQIATVTTDKSGIAKFSYYAHSLGGDFLALKIKDAKGNEYSTDSKLQPVGSQVTLTPLKYWLEKGEKIQIKLDTLSKGDWHIDVFNHGNWIYSSKNKTNGAPIHLELPLPENVDGLLQIQVASDFTNPHTTFDAAYIFVNDMKKVKINQNDERFVKNRDNAENLVKLKQEKSFKRFWRLMGQYGSESPEIIEKWKKKINNVSLNQMGYEPMQLAEQILRELPKDYILLPHMLNTSKSKQTSFLKEQRSDRTMALFILGVSGLFVVLVIIIRIWREMTLRDQQTGIKTGGQHVLGLITLLIIIITGYAMMLYLFSILDWYKDL